jgi:hypothetical protein
MVELRSIDAHFAPAPWPWVASAVLDGEAVLYDEDTGRVHLLNESASIVWQLLDGESTIEAIGRDVAAAVGADALLVISQVIDLVRMLAELGVIVGFDHAAIEPPSP